MTQVLALDSSAKMRVLDKARVLPGSQAEQAAVPVAALKLLA